MRFAQQLGAVRINWILLSHGWKGNSLAGEGLPMCHTPSGGTLKIGHSVLVHQIRSQKQSLL